MPIPRCPSHPCSTCAASFADVALYIWLLLRLFPPLLTSARHSTAIVPPSPPRLQRCTSCCASHATDWWHASSSRPASCDGGAPVQCSMLSSCARVPAPACNLAALCMEARSACKPQYIVGNLWAVHATVHHGCCRYQLDPRCWHHWLGRAYGCLRLPIQAQAFETLRLHSFLIEFT